MTEETMLDPLTRRTLLQRGAAGGAALALGATAAGQAQAQGRLGLGAPQPDPRNLLDLPPGFRYRIVQNVEGRLGRRRNGARVPGDFDGMAAFRGRQRGTTVLVRNHELGIGDDPDAAPVEGRNPFRRDDEAKGGTTALVVGRDGRLLDSYVASSGTKVNCAGGATPWGTWITCEEIRAGDDHGWAFEVNPDRPQDRISKTPIRAMGQFSHEAVDIDPRTGIVYLTEDDFAGEIPATPRLEGVQSRVSSLFRFIPRNRARRPGALQEGGKLQVLTLTRRRGYNVDLADPRERFRVVWQTVRPDYCREDALRKGGARFQRLEGCNFAGGALYFSDTNGGDRRHGQVFRLIPSGDPRGGGRDRLELFLEGDAAVGAADLSKADQPDNLIVTPWGDLWFVEDGLGVQRVMGITPGGRTYEFARNRLLGAEGAASEFAGPTFSPDGRTFFVNVQYPGHTFAITGPFPRRNPRRRAELSARSPRHPWAPRVDEGGQETALKEGLAPAEVAAARALGAEL